MSEVADVLDPSVKPSVEDTTGKTVEPSIVSDKSVDDVGKDTPERDGIDWSHADTTEGLGVNVNPSVEDMLNRLKDSTPLGGDVLKSSVDDFIKETVASHVRGHCLESKRK
ncbi:hypothetical protein LIER_35853 [Lithospermum erythrorhizon]|uniref:Uncharacterized protein n=1 Tax=Lithospermum erythrorhizon TaxID=34254 RepID=A0AAV3NX76_LITER